MFKEICSENFGYILANIQQYIKKTIRKKNLNNKNVDWNKMIIETVVFLSYNCNCKNLKDYKHFSFHLKYSPLLI